MKPIQLPQLLQAWRERLGHARHHGPSLQLKQPMLAVEWDRTEIRWAAAAWRKDEASILSAGHLERNLDLDPLSQLQSHLKDQQVQVSQIILVLSRSDLELVSLTLPSVDESELIALVQSEVEQRLGDSEHPPIADYVPPKASDNGTVEVLVFSQSDRQFMAWQAKCQEIGCKLVAITSRHISPILLLEAKQRLVRPRSVMVAVYAGEVELVVCYRSTPHFVRSIRLGSEDADTVAEQIALEIQRSLAIEPQSDLEQPLDIFMFGHASNPSPLAEALRNRKVGEIAIINALVPWKDSRSDSSLNIATDAATLGALYGALHESLPINLVHPKRPPRPVSPLRRWGPIGGLATAALAVATYFLWSDVASLQSEVEQVQAKAEFQVQRSKKQQERSDEIDWLANWEANRIDWLKAFSDLSEKMPPRELSTVRRLSASTIDGGAQIDLGLQVRDPETLAQLESRMRAANFEVSSKRVTEQSADEEYPWSFETHIEFPNPKKSWRYRPPATADSDDQPTDPAIPQETTKHEELTKPNEDINGDGSSTPVEKAKTTPPEKSLTSPDKRDEPPSAPPSTPNAGGDA